MYVRMQQKVTMAGLCWTHVESDDDDDQSGVAKLTSRVCCWKTCMQASAFMDQMRMVASSEQEASSAPLGSHCQSDSA